MCGGMRRSVVCRRRPCEARLNHPIVIVIESTMVESVVLTGGGGEAWCVVGVRTYKARTDWLSKEGIEAEGCRGCWRRHDRGCSWLLVCID